MRTRQPAGGIAYASMATDPPRHQPGLGIGGLWPGLGHALTPWVLDSRAAEYALNKRLHDFQAVFQGHRHASHALAPLGLPSPRRPQAIVGEALPRPKP